MAHILGITLILILLFYVKFLKEISLQMKTNMIYHYLDTFEHYSGRKLSAADDDDDDLIIIITLAVGVPTVILIVVIAVFVCWILRKRRRGFW